MKISSVWHLPNANKPPYRIIAAWDLDNINLDSWNDDTRIQGDFVPMLLASQLIQLDMKGRLFRGVH